MTKSNSDVRKIKSFVMVSQRKGRAFQFWHEIESGNEGTLWCEWKLIGWQPAPLKEKNGNEFISAGAEPVVGNDRKIVRCDRGDSKKLAGRWILQNFSDVL